MTTIDSMMLKSPFVLRSRSAPQPAPNAPQHECLPPAEQEIDRYYDGSDQTRHRNFAENINTSANAAFANSGNSSMNIFWTKLVRLSTPAIDAGLKFAGRVLIGGIESILIGQDALDGLLSERA